MTKVTDDKILAYLNPEGYTDLLSQYGIKVNPKDYDSIAKGIHYLWKNGNENDIAKIIAIHPHKEMIVDWYKKYGKEYGFEGDFEEPETKKTETAVANPAATNQNANNSNQQQFIISPAALHTLIGVFGTMAGVLTIITIVKAVK